MAGTRAYRLSPIVTGYDASLDWVCYTGDKVLDLLGPDIPRPLNIVSPESLQTLAKRRTRSTHLVDHRSSPMANPINQCVPLRPEIPMEARKDRVDGGRALDGRS